MQTLIRLNHFLSKTFAFWVLFFAFLAYQLPSLFSPFLHYIPYLLGIVMFGMGITLTFKDFSEVIRNPKAVFIGVVAQFIVMPSVAFILVKIFSLPTELAVGVILVGSCPGGTSSNVMTYLARGNTALSLACTTLSTLLAPILTPLVFYLLASQWIDINAVAMFVSVLKIVLLPVFLGLIIRTFFKHSVAKISQSMPLISVVAIVLILSAVVAVSKNRIIDSGLIIFAVVVLHNCFGYLIGFWIAKILKLNLYDSKAISLEVGMQNSGLGAALATAFFNPVSAVPSAVFSFWHNVSGPILANFFASREDKNNKMSNIKD
ncbi:sodium transporter [Mergibacter septicus]|uniref:Sodium transporter n=1 Tax=Mergibacter septicus TaxID=221402 RepID=A0A8D4IXE0_9PAST|nr:bile acid:sodium symporter family protein [Mergibacter septicus]AWX15361.1 sodium transporter [Mergibacter septicus]QDJ14615.1 sodium transporter [Mergibacter septicus]UTU47952.1 bile acid:sodium symporter family protein [Mergibacter septicus]WMR96442.1 bile acid:sodium symporter family protein [Mergibacter septicus]